MLRTSKALTLLWIVDHLERKVPSPGFGDLRMTAQLARSLWRRFISCSSRPHIVSQSWKMPLSASA